MITLALLIVLISAIIYLIKWGKRKNEFWEKRGIKHLKTNLFFGNALETVLGKKHTGEVLQELCRAYPEEDLLGYYHFTQPHLIVRSPDLVERVLVKDFASFADRGLDTDEQRHPWNTNLFNMCGNQWRAFRYKLSPLFTSGKLKYMFKPLAQCGENLTKILDEHVGRESDTKDIMDAFSMDVIGSCAFGIDPGVLQNPESNFREMGKKIFHDDPLHYFRLIVIVFFPKIARKLKISFMQNCVVNYFCNIVKDALKTRRETGIERPDFVQLMVQLKEKGKIELQMKDPNDDYLNQEVEASSVDTFELTDDLLIGSAFGFISAGFHTTSTTMSYTLFELSQKPEFLEKVRMEIRDQYRIHGGLTYDAIKCMTYLEKCIKETLRIHPLVLNLLRVCTKKYTFPTGYTAYPGESVQIPVLALHMDETNFPEPTLFNPDRFDNHIKPGIYLPFGDGPRICIAMRFAMMEMKYGLAKVLQNYNIELNPKTKTPLEISARGFLNTPKNKMIFNLTKSSVLA